MLFGLFSVGFWVAFWSLLDHFLVAFGRFSVGFCGDLVIELGAGGGNADWMGWAVGGGGRGGLVSRNLESLE